MMKTPRLERLASVALRHSVPGLERAADATLSSPDSFELTVVLARSAYRDARVIRQSVLLDEGIPIGVVSKV